MGVNLVFFNNGDNAQLSIIAHKGSGQCDKANCHKTSKNNMIRIVRNRRLFEPFFNSLFGSLSGFFGFLFIIGALLDKLFLLLGGTTLAGFGGFFTVTHYKIK
jgi:hypothetical protein